MNRVTSTVFRANPVVRLGIVFWLVWVPRTASSVPDSSRRRTRNVSVTVVVGLAELTHHQ